MIADGAPMRGGPALVTGGTHPARSPAVARIASTRPPIPGITPYLQDGPSQTDS